MIHEIFEPQEAVSDQPPVGTADRVIKGNDMKKRATNMRYLVLTVLMAIVLSSSFYGNSSAKEPDSSVSLDQVKQQAGQTLDAAKNYTIEQKQEFQKKMEAELADLSKRISELKTKADTAKQEASASLEAKIAELKRKQQDLQNKLPELKAATSSAWEKVKTQVDAGMEDLKRAYEGTKSHSE